MSSTDFTSQTQQDYEHPQVSMRRASPHFRAMYVAHNILFDLAMMTEPQLRATRDECQLALNKGLQMVDGPSVNLFAALAKYCDLVLSDLEAAKQV